MNIKTILIVAAHPDDEILGCGGLIARSISEGCKIKVLFLGEGSTCRFDDVDSEQAKLAVQKRNDNAVLALQELGVDDFDFINLPCGRFDQTPILKINKILERVIRDFRPDAVFTHSEHDSNNDHRIVFRSTIMATRPCGEHIVKKLFSYEVPSSSEWGYVEAFRPNYFFSLTENELYKKWKALEHYEGETREYPFPRSRTGIYNLARQRGMQSGVSYAEAYLLIREFL